MVFDSLDGEGILGAEAYCGIVVGGVGEGLELKDIACARWCRVFQRILGEELSTWCSSCHLHGRDWYRQWVVVFPLPRHNAPVTVCGVQDPAALMRMFQRLIRSMKWDGGCLFSVLDLR
jgi:hypothetical protein